MDKDKRKAVAKGLRAARDKMNHGGRHWIKGALRRRMIAGETAYFTPGGNNPAWGEIGYCSIGGINAVSGKGERAVVDEGLRGPMKKALALAILRDKGGHFNGYHMPADGKTITVADAEGVIIGFNDKQATCWDDVKRVFTDAAKHV